MAPRSVDKSYRDPVDEIWLAAAERLGIRVERTRDAYAAYDGQGTLRIAESADFDADDSLAQMILHELCHALVAGPDALEREDWGLSNVDDSDLALEHACHRLQAALSGRHGLRELFAVTTDHRAYWDALPADTLAPGEDPAIEIARRAWVQARRSAFWRVLEEALAATRAVADVAARHAGDTSLWKAPTPLHAKSGFPLHAHAGGQDGLRCGDCAWADSDRRGHVCRQSKSAERRAVRVAAEDAACERWEARLDVAVCRRCGACCREGFDLVQLHARDSLIKAHPELVAEDRFGRHVPRPGGRCAALDGDGVAADYSCRVYELRPRSCRDFAIAGDACLEARRRVGLSR